MKKEELLQNMVPEGPEWRIPWREIEHSSLSPLICRMKQTMQNPAWHGEGDVWTHTRMVCECLTSLEAYRLLERRKQEEVFLAALLHDIGKIPCTRQEEGIWTSPGHTAAGARMARELLWLDWGLCGTEEKQIFRETICALIRHHSVPLHILDQPSPERRVLQIAAEGELASDFSVELLCLLARADVTGRQTSSAADSLELIELCAAQAEEAGCLKGPFPFPTAYGAYRYLSGGRMAPGQPLYDDTWGQVILMSGLPGTGKDTWIRENGQNRPVISLDQLRREMGVSHTEAQGPVISRAREMARGYLRRKIPFIWNATCLTPVIREKQVGLFTDYHASVRIVFLETGWEEELRRNRERTEQVPEPVIRRMLGNMTLPRRFEAHEVAWLCV